MKSYLVNIRRPTRKGSELLIQKFVNSELEITKTRSHFAERYQGFIVDILEAENVELLSVPEPIQPLKTTKKDTLRDLPVKLTQEEKELFKAADLARREYKKAEEALTDAIEKRIKKYAFIRGADKPVIGYYNQDVKITVRLDSDMYTEYLSENQDITNGNN